MIRFRCWYCHRKYAMPDEKIGERRECDGCKRQMRVPKRDDGNSRVRSLVDWLIEFTLYGVGCGLLGFGLGLLIVVRNPFSTHLTGEVIVIALTAIGFVTGVVFRDRALTFFKEKTRDRENS